MSVTRNRFFWLPVLLTLAGCSSPPATLDLITAARAALADAKQAELAAHEAQAQQAAAEMAALGAGFDADVQRVSAGQLLDAKGQPIAFNAQWVMEARQGYSAAMQAIAANERRADAAHGTRLDNLQAGDEALQMATDLITQQMNTTEPIRQQLLALQRRWINGK